LNVAGLVPAVCAIKMKPSICRDEHRRCEGK
jgi:hypothetical protein